MTVRDILKTGLPAPQTNKTIPAWFTWTPTEARIAAGALLLCFVARFHALLPGYSIDDYRLFRGDLGEAEAERALRDGRALLQAMRVALSKIDALPPYSFVLGWFVLSAALIVAGILLARMWGVDRKPAAVLATVLVVALHPYQTELFTFHVMTLFVGIGLILSFLALALCVRSRSYWLASVVMLAASLSLYQVIINYMALAIVFAALFYWTTSEQDRTWIMGGLIPRISACFVAVVLYMIVNKLVAIVYQVPLHSRTQMVALSEIPTRLRLIVERLSVMFAIGEPVVPAGTKLLLLAFAAVWFAWAVTMAVRRRQSWRNGLCLAAAMLAGVPLALGIIAVLKDWWPVPRVTSQISIFWAGAIAFCLIHSTGVVRRVLAVIAGIAIFAFIAGDNHIVLDQLRLNMRDIAKANRIIERLEALPDFPQLRGVIIHGGYWSYPLPLQTTEGDLNVSSLYAPKAKIPLLNEVSGYNFATALPPPSIQKAVDAYCHDAPKWPAAQSVTSLESYGVVCLVGP